MAIFDRLRPISTNLAGGGQSMLKMIGMMKRRPGMSPQEFARYWREEHAPLGFEVLPDDIPIRGYIQNYTHRTEGDSEPEFDGIVEVWFDDMETFQRWFTWYFSDGAKPMRDDEANFMDSGAIKLLLMDEAVVVEPPAARS
jgi:uncharacterized protein (TIGR02118 family)